MSASATFSVAPCPQVGPGARRFAVDCEHGTTTAIVSSGAASIDDTDVLRLLLFKHELEEGCTCTADLWSRCAVAEAHL